MQLQVATVCPRLLSRLSLSRRETRELRYTPGLNYRVRDKTANDTNPMRVNCDFIRGEARFVENAGPRRVDRTGGFDSVFRFAQVFRRDTPTKGKQILGGISGNCFKVIYSPRAR